MYVADLKPWILGLAFGLTLAEVRADQNTPIEDQQYQYTAANGRGFSNQGYFYNQDQNQTYFYQQGPYEDSPWDEGDRQRLRQRTLRRQQNLQQQNPGYNQQYYNNPNNQNYNNNQTYPSNQYGN